MNSLSSLGWWISNLPSVIEEVSITQQAKDALKQAFLELASSSDEGIKRVSRVCEVFDKWLECCGLQLGCVRSSSDEDSVPKPLEALVQWPSDETTRTLIAELGIVDVSGKPEALCESTLMGRLFDASVQACRETGRPAHAAAVVRAIRTLLLGLKKWSICDSSTRSHRASRCIGDFVARQERDLRLQRDLHSGVLGVILDYARYILADVLRDFEELLAYETAPRPGPGATAEGFSPLQKWGRIGNSGSWYFASLLDVRDDEGMPRTLSDGALCTTLGAARICAVNKDYWRDRVITVEPNDNVFCQMMSRQAMLLCMARHPCTSHLRPDRQDWQQEAAVRGSRVQVEKAPEKCAPDHSLASLRKLTDSMRIILSQGEIRDDRSTWESKRLSKESTLDFSDASDYITHELVTRLMPPNVMAALNSCRSFYVELEEGGKPTRKVMRSYAGMGNATTFVIETLVFWAVTYAQLALFRGLKTPDLALRAPGLAKQVKVYGDDLIIPADLCNYSRLLVTFSECGWRLNTEKSFYRMNGSFRESCGVHAFLGEEVTPIRIRGYDVKNHSDLVAVADKVRQLIPVFPELAKRIFEVSGLSNTHVPNGTLTGQACLLQNEWSEKNPLPLRWNSKLCRMEIRVPHAVPLREQHKGGFSELILAALCGYHYYCSRFNLETGRPSHDGRKARKGQRKEGRPSKLCYSSPLPRRVRIDESWFPTSPWGRDLAAVGL